jgi:signal transduction histidine kinase
MLLSRSAGAFMREWRRKNVQHRRLGRKRVPLRSLRSKILLVLVGAALIAAASGAALTEGMRRADRLIERAHLSQSQLELLMLLAGRVTDFSVVVMEAAGTPQERRAAIASAATEVSAVFDLIEASIEKQVAVLAAQEERSAEAAEGLGIARMRAQFQSLSQQLGPILAQGAADLEERQGKAKAALDIFGMGFAPILTRAVDNERREVQAAWAAMTALKSNLLTVAAALAGGALAFSVLLYLGPVRAVLRRLQETVAGAEAIASGRLDTRISQEGRDELAALMAGFNRMAESLARREADLVAGQQGLQRTIAARTAELSAANTRLEEIDANRRRFFADVSHELRTPLTVILGEAELLLRHGGLADGARASIETVQNRARRLNRRIDDMLRVARSESGRLELSLTDAEAGAIVADAVEDTLAIARRSGIEVRLERGPGNLYVHGDRDWLRQMCSGLIANAIRYSRGASVIEVAARAEDGAAVLEVSDRGQGIPAEEQGLVFDRFFKGRNGADAQAGDGESGHGVGLALAKWIVDEHHGRIELMSPGRLAGGDGAPGTTVIVRLGLSEGAEGMKN